MMPGVRRRRDVETLETVGTIDSEVRAISMFLDRKKTQTKTKKRLFLVV
jgi:hypothetical protein